MYVQFPEAKLGVKIMLLYFVLFHTFEQFNVLCNFLSKLKFL